MRKVNLIGKFILCTFIVLLLGGHFVFGSTLPETIQKLKINLVPHTDGSMEVTYYIDYGVNTQESSELDVMEIDLYTNDFEILSYSPTEYFNSFEKMRSSVNSSRILLDFAVDQIQEHKPFAFNFTLLQDRLFYEGQSEDRITIDFIPAHFEEKLIKEVAINLDRTEYIPVAFESKPDTTTSEKYSWYFTNLEEGAYGRPITFTYLKKDFTFITDIPVKSNIPFKLLVRIGIIIFGLIAYAVFIRFTGDKYAGDSRHVLHQPKQSD